MSNTAMTSERGLMYIADVSRITRRQLDLLYGAAYTIKRFGRITSDMKALHEVDDLARVDRSFAAYNRDFSFMLLQQIPEATVLLRAMERAGRPFIKYSGGPRDERYLAENFAKVMPLVDRYFSEMYATDVSYREVRGGLSSDQLAENLKQARPIAERLLHDIHNIMYADPGDKLAASIATAKSLARYV